MRKLREVKGSDNFSNFPTLYKKDKERAKKQVLYVFSPHLHLLTFFLDNLLKFIVNLQPVIKINKPKQKESLIESIYIHLVRQLYN